MVLFFVLLISPWLRLFCPLTRPSSRDRNSIKTTAAAPMARLTRLYRAWFRGVLLPEGLEITNEVSEKYFEYTSLEKNEQKNL